jgi:hypothetical protein
LQNFDWTLVTLTTDYLKQAIRATVPLSKTMDEELARLRSWAAGRARPASEPGEKTVEEYRRKIEL